MGNEVRKTMNLKNRTSCLFKIVLFIIFSIFVAEIIVLPKIEHDMLKEAGRQELVTVQQPVSYTHLTLPTILLV